MPSSATSLYMGGSPCGGDTCKIYPKEEKYCSGPTQLSGASDTNIVVLSSSVIWRGLLKMQETHDRLSHDHQKSQVSDLYVPSS